MAQSTSMRDLERMRIGILRPIAGFSFSMDVYADGLVDGLKTVKPDWEIVELAPTLANPKGNPILAGMEKYYQRYWHYPRQLQQHQIDLFHIIDHSDGHLLYWLNKLPKPKIITCHDLINLTQPASFQGRSILPLVSLASWKFAVRGMRHADRIIAVSNYTAKDVTQHLDIAAASIASIPNAVDSRFQPIPQSAIEFRQQQNLDKQDFCLLNVGSNNSRKNIDTILKAIALLKQDLPIHFWKAGADFNPAQKSFIAERNLSDCVTYLGKPSPEQLVQIYNAADALVAPSSYEGFGLTILEAMACGTPVITSNVTSLPEVAGNAAILVAPTDIEAIVAAISRLQGDADYRQMLREKGLARSKQFTWVKTAERVVRVYQQALLNA